MLRAAILVQAAKSEFPIRPNTASTRLDHDQYSPPGSRRPDDELASAPSCVVASSWKTGFAVTSACRLPVPRSRSWPGGSGRPLPCPKNLHPNGAQPGIRCGCLTSITPRRQFCKALAQSPRNAPRLSLSMTSSLGTAPNPGSRSVARSSCGTAMSWRQGGSPLRLSTCGWRPCADWPTRLPTMAC